MYDLDTHSVEGQFVDLEYLLDSKAFASPYQGVSAMRHEANSCIVPPRLKMPLSAQLANTDTRTSAGGQIVDVPRKQSLSVVSRSALMEQVVILRNLVAAQGH